MADVRIFLSAVTAEFGSYREALRHDLDGPGVTLKVQEDFIAAGTATLIKLDDYIRSCDVVFHLVGDMTGALAQSPSVSEIRQRYPDLAQKLPSLAAALEQPEASPLSYTQWEAWLALLHRRPLVIAVPEKSAQREESQTSHLARLAQFERYPEIRFESPGRLAIELLRTLRHIAPQAAAVAKPIHLPLRSLGALFTGRAACLSEVERSLGSVPGNPEAPATARVLNGIGGGGKTRVALEYAWRHASKYSALLFVSATTPATLHHNLASLCDRATLNLPEQTETDENKQYAAVLKWLAGQPGWLIIFDNVDSEEAASAVEQLLPRLRAGHVLITSRLTNWSSGLALPRLELLDADAAAEFLLSRTEQRRRKSADDSMHARELATELGRLALALEQAGASIGHYRLSFAEYLEKWQSQRRKVLEWFDSRLMQYDRSLLITWQTSFDQLREPAQRLLRRLAWFSPEPIPESLLKVRMPDFELGSDDATDALTELDACSLVTRSDDAASFSIHRLIQEISRLSQREGSGHESLAAALRWMMNAFVGDPQDTRTWPTLDPLAPHAMSIALEADVAGITSPTNVLINNCGLLLIAKAQLAAAGQLLERALVLHEKVLGPRHPAVATGLNNLANLYQEQGAYPQAAALYARALPILEEALGPSHPNLATSLNNLGGLHINLGAFAQAEPLLLRALPILEKGLGPEDPQVGMALHNLAALYLHRADYLEAQGYCSRAVEILEKVRGADHPQVAASVSVLASILERQGQYSLAESHYLRALAIREKALGPGHPGVGLNLSDLGGLYRSQGDLAKAAAACTRALQVLENALGLEHPYLAVSLSNLAAVHDNLGNFPEAEALCQRSLSILEKTLGKSHPDVATNLNNLAALYQKQGAFDKAESLSRRSLEILEKALPPDHPTIVTAQNNLAVLHQKRGDFPAAAALMARSLKSIIRTVPSAHPLARSVLQNYAGVLQQMGKTEAEYHRELESLIEQAHSPDKDA